MTPPTLPLTDNGLEVAEGDGDDEEKYEKRPSPEIVWGDADSDDDDYVDDDDDLEEYLFQVS